MYASFFWLVVLTHGRMPKFSWRVFANPVSAWNFAPFIWRAFLFVAWMCFFLLIFLHLRQSFPSNLMQEKTIVLFYLWLFANVSRGYVRHDWTCMSLLWNIVHVLSTDNTLPRSSLRRLSFLFDSWWLILFPQVCVPSRRKWLQLLIGNKIENNWPVSDYRRYSFILNRKQ